MTRDIHIDGDAADLSRLDIDQRFALCLNDLLDQADRFVPPPVGEQILNGEETL